MSKCAVCGKWSITWTYGSCVNGIWKLEYLCALCNRWAAEIEEQYFVEEFS